MSPRHSYNCCSSKKPKTKWMHVLLLHLTQSESSSAFRPMRNCSYRTARHGLPEWRDDYDSSALRKPALLLPFAADEALLQGQSMDIVLKDGRFFDLFQDCIDQHSSIVGMALMGDDGILKEMPLCEIHDFEVNSGYRGRVSIDVTLRAVGRAKIMELTQMKPIMSGTVRELIDGNTSDSSLLRANEMANDIENEIQHTSRLENGIDRYERYKEVYEVALFEASTQRRLSTSDSSARQRSVSELTAASWAVFAILSDKSKKTEAIATTDLLERLQLGLKGLLDEKYEISTDPYRYTTDSDAGFE